MANFSSVINALSELIFYSQRMRLISDGVWSASKTHMKLLRTVEELSKAQENIPVEVLRQKAKVRGNFLEYMVDLVKLKFISYSVLGYRLTVSGHDCLAINALRARGLEAMGDKVGVGKEADIYIGQYGGRSVVLKFHRLGRTSFRTVRKNRDYTKGRPGWLALCRVSCRREVEYLEMFRDMAVPAVVDCNRHVIVQELLDYAPLYKTRIENVSAIHGLMIEFIKDLWHRGYVHGDFNEFNVLVREDIRVIDFPQCIPSADERALAYLKRDFKCVEQYFARKYRYRAEPDCFIEFMKELGISEDPVEEVGMEAEGYQMEDAKLKT
jgi:RIO kinase 2